MKKLLIIVCAGLMAMGMTVSAQAFSLSFDDEYIGADDHNLGDVIGDKGLFDITGATVDFDPVTGEVTVTINTNFTPGDDFTIYDLSIDYGDLFISNNGWNPVDPTVDDYAPTYDNGTAYGSGEAWEYVIDSETGGIYETSQGTILHSDDLMDPQINPGENVTYRNGQEVIFEPGRGAEAIGQAYVDITTIVGPPPSSSLAYTFDLNALGYTPGTLVGFHWAMTCANDVIEFAYDPVPEPSTVLLLGLGLLGIVGVARKRMKK